MSPRRFWLLVGLAALVLALGAWLSSGTLAPYGTHVQGKCQYRVNIDDPHFSAPYRMLEGKPKAEWEYSVVLRRILHPILAYPWVKAFGFQVGGFLFNVFSHVLALVAIAYFFRRFYDDRAALLATWLFATYPGYAYWIGLPYSYAFIVPGCVTSAIALLWWREKPSTARSAVAANIIGLVALGYDLMPFFAGALVFLLVLHKRWRDIAISVAILVAWLAFIGKGVPAIFGFPAVNSNTQSYGAVFESYFDIHHRLSGWGQELVAVPRIFVGNFVFSGFVFFPVLLVWMLAVRTRWRMKPIVDPVAACILLATLGVFLFLNAAPPYDNQWQLRGTWIARLYQPWFVAVLIIVASTSVALRNTKRHRLVLWSVIAIVVIDAAVIAGPFVGLTPLWAGVHQRFYQAPGHNRNTTWIKKLGRRPLGVCK
jgi:hypothetical protein